MNARKPAPAPTPALEVRPFAYRRRRLHCDAVDLTPLAETHGTPLYVYSATQIIERFQLFQQAFAHGPEARPQLDDAFSYEGGRDVLSAFASTRARRRRPGRASSTR